MATVISLKHLTFFFKYIPIQSPLISHSITSSPTCFPFGRRNLWTAPCNSPNFIIVSVTVPFSLLSWMLKLAAFELFILTLILLRYMWAKQLTLYSGRIHHNLAISSPLLKLNRRKHVTINATVRYRSCFLVVAFFKESFGIWFCQILNKHTYTYSRKHTHITTHTHTYIYIITHTPTYTCGKGRLT